MASSKDAEIEAMVAEAAAETNRDLLIGPWPEDPGQRLEAKVDKLLTNHFPHIEARITRLEDTFLSKQKWQFWMALLTMILLAAVLLAK